MRAAAILTLIASAAAAQQCVAPVVRPSQPNIFSEQQETYLAEAMLAHRAPHIRLVRDARLTEYLQRIGARLTAHMPASELPWRFEIVDAPEANAWNWPGGLIQITRKLIAAAEDEDELAGVIGHELGHAAAHDGASNMSRLLREMLGVREAGGREQILAHYHRMIDEARKHPQEHSGGTAHSDQVEADEFGLYLTWAAGYDPAAGMRLFDRIAGVEGRTGNRLTRFFNMTPPGADRVAGMVRRLGAFDGSCRRVAREGARSEFAEWRDAVVRWRPEPRLAAGSVRLQPVLRPEIQAISFSADGRWLLAKDASGVTVLSREPFQVVRRIESGEAETAAFAPGSDRVVIAWRDHRIEIYPLPGGPPEVRTELAKRPCVAFVAAPSGDIAVCFNPERELVLYDTVRGTELFRRKGFGPQAFGPAFPGVNWPQPQVGVSFSPDGRWMSAVSWNEKIFLDLDKKQELVLPKAVRAAASSDFAWLPNGRIAALNEREPKQSRILGFPDGAAPAALVLPTNTRLRGTGDPKYLVAGPVGKYAAIVIDIERQEVVRAGSTAALDVYAGVLAAERTDGELALYDLRASRIAATARLPQAVVDKVQWATASPDLRWLSLSGENRGLLWDLGNGRANGQLLKVRSGFLGGDGMLTGVQEGDEGARRIVRMDAQTGHATAGEIVPGTLAQQHGPWVASISPREGEQVRLDLFRGMHNVNLEWRDASTGAVVWKREYRELMPAFRYDTGSGLIVWASRATRGALKDDPKLAKLMPGDPLDAVGIVLLEAADPRTGASRMRALVNTGRGSFDVVKCVVAGGRMLVADNQNRVLAYEAGTAAPAARMFGKLLAAGGGLALVERTAGEWVVVDASLRTVREVRGETAALFAQFDSSGRRVLIVDEFQNVRVIETPTQ